MEKDDQSTNSSMHVDCGMEKFFRDLHKLLIITQFMLLTVHNLKPMNNIKIFIRYRQFKELYRAQAPILLCLLKLTSTVLLVA